MDINLIKTILSYSFSNDEINLIKKNDSLSSIDNFFSKELDSNELEKNSFDENLAIEALNASQDELRESNIDEDNQLDLTEGINMTWEEYLQGVDKVDLASVVSLIVRYQEKHDASYNTRISQLQEIFQDRMQKTDISELKNSIRVAQAWNSQAPQDSEDAKIYSATADFLKQKVREIPININEKVDVNYKQGQEGDCWLLAGLKSMSLSETGKKAIDDAITINNDGTYSVEFIGINGVKFTFTNNDILNGRTRLDLSAGDDDVLLLELAVEKALDGIRQGQIKVDNPELFGKTKENSSPLRSGALDYLTQLMLGKTPKRVFNEKFVSADEPKNYAKDLSEVYDEIMQHQTDLSFSAVISFSGNTINSKLPVDRESSNFDTQNHIYVFDAGENPKERMLASIGGGHAWSLLAVADDTITLANPWDTSEAIVFNKNDVEPYISSISYMLYDKQVENLNIV